VSFLNWRLRSAACHQRSRRAARLPAAHTAMSRSLAVAAALVVAAHRGIGGAAAAAAAEPRRMPEPVAAAAASAAPGPPVESVAPAAAPRPAPPAGAPEEATSAAAPGGGAPAGGGGGDGGAGAAAGGCSGGGSAGCSAPTGAKWDRWDMAGSTYQCKCATPASAPEQRDSVCRAQTASRDLLPARCNGSSTIPLRRVVRAARREWPRQPLLRLVEWQAWTTTIPTRAPPALAANRKSSPCRTRSQLAGRRRSQPCDTCRIVSSRR
jgi:hypothetical protein